jgi:putative nucleotidyltransferase with HDIG domain
MKIETAFLKSKVARRIFALFVFCALVPILALAIFSFTQVRSELLKQSQRWLHEASRSMGTSIYERLFFLINDLRVLSLSLEKTVLASESEAERALADHLMQRFLSITWIQDAGDSVPVLGKAEPVPPLSQGQRDHLESGKTLLYIQPADEFHSRIFLLRLLDPQDANQGLLLAEIHSPYLWDLQQDNTLPTMTELCVLDPSNRVIFSTHPVPTSFRQPSAFGGTRSSLSRWEWEYQGTEYLAGYWSVFLETHFLLSRITVVMSSPKDYILSPISYFKQIFPPVILLSFLVVVLLTILQIRRTTQPIEELTEGTRRIAMRDFDSRVDVKSGDEFEDLGISFNHMSRQLGRQFNALTTMAEIDRAILSSLDTRRIVETAIMRTQDFFGYELVCATLLDPRGNERPQTYMVAGNSGVRETTLTVDVTPNEKQHMGESPWLIYHADQDVLPAYLKTLNREGIRWFAVLPINLTQGLAGFITLGSAQSAPLDEEELLHARQLSDQMAVALANAHLLEDLDSMNWGTLRALARTVDAKSPWTAGHSERVTATALEIGTALGLGDEEMENLHRGGLLHDIGKIGIPVSILDKPNRLTDEEYSVVQGHSRIGARILEPIAAYAAVIPMVLHHHERFDGKGYPDGLHGESIDLGARILAVADVFDSLISDRPYRKAMEYTRVLEILKQGAGYQFDPDVVRAFLDIATRNGWGHRVEGHGRRIRG